MANLNKVMLIGNLTRDPEMRVTPKGTALCSFALEINRRFKDETGFEKEEVTFVECEMWGKRGEVIGKYVVKGNPLYVEGRLRLDQWEDKNTKEKRSRMKVVLEAFEFLGDGRAGGAGGAGGGGGDPAGSFERSSPPPRANPAGPAPAKENLDEDVPF